jgi:hypothetical protein
VRAGRTGRALSVAAAVVGVVFAGHLLASNMGFHLEHTLLGPEDSATGTNWLALPWITASGIDSAADLFEELGGATKVEYVARIDPASKSMQAYTGAPEGDFPLSPGEGLIVKMKETVAVDVFGSHDQTASFTFLGPEDAMSGDNQYAPPYHGTAGTAGELIEEIGGSFAASVTRWIAETDGIQTYDGSTGSDFPLVPGQAYRVRVNRTVEYVPTVVP